MVVPQGPERGRKPAGNTGGSSPGRAIARWLIIAFFVLGIAGAVYYFVAMPTKGGQAGAECMILIDRTASASEAKSQLPEIAQRAVDGCADIDAALTVAYFDQSGPKLESSGEPLELFEPERKVASQRERAVAKGKRDAHERVKEVFSGAFEDGSKHRGSDIVGALRAAGYTIDQAAFKHGVSEKRLIILTDGLQMSAGVTVEHFTADTDVAAEIAKAKALDLLPKLDGVEVYMFGVGIGGTEIETGDQTVAEFDQKLKQFWGALVDASGGTKCRYEETTDIAPGNCKGWD